MKQFEVKMKCTIYKTAIFECKTIEHAEGFQDEGFPLEYAPRVTKTAMTDWEVLDVEESK